MLHHSSRTVNCCLGNVLHSKLSLQIPGIILFCVCLWGHVQFCCELFSSRTYKAEAPQTFWPWNTNICNQTQKTSLKWAAETMGLNCRSVSKLQKQHQIEIPEFFPFVLYLHKGITKCLCQQIELFLLPWFVSTDYSHICSFLLVPLFAALAAFLQRNLSTSHHSSCIIVWGPPVPGALPATPRPCPDLRLRCRAGFHILPPTGVRTISSNTPGTREEDAPSLWLWAQASRRCSGKQERRKCFVCHTVFTSRAALA